MAEPYWAVAVAQPNRERFVQSMLAWKGFESYVPRILTAKGRSAPLFPSYVAVRVTDVWYGLRWSPGVVRVLMNGERPARLEDSVVEEIRQREEGGFVQLPREQGLERGQKVRVLHGMFAGRTAIYEGMTGSQREKVLLDILGQVVPVDMPLGYVEAV